MEHKLIDPKQVDKVLNSLEGSSVEELIIGSDKNSIHIVRANTNKTVSKNVEVEIAPAPAANIEKSITVDKETIIYKDILSTEVGIFSRSDAKKNILVKLRDEVQEGQVLAYIKSTGIMYEVKSEYSGKITEILVEDGQAVEFAQPLFRLK